MTPLPIFRASSAQRPNLLEQTSNRDGTDTGRQRKRLISRVDDIQSGELQVSESASHGSGELWRRGSLNLKAKPIASANDQQVQFGTSVRSPEVTLFGVCSEMADDL